VYNQCVDLSAVEWSGLFRALFYLNECKNFAIGVLCSVQYVGRSCNVMYCRVRYCTVYNRTIFFLPLTYSLNCDCRS
jgi:hypothetical protein